MQSPLPVTTSNTPLSCHPGSPRPNNPLPPTHTHTFLPPQASLSGTNIFDASVENGVTAWDTAAENPSIAEGVATSETAQLPCYATGSPLGGYLGGDVAYQSLAWGNADGAGQPISLLPPNVPATCYSDSGSSAFWQVGSGEAGRSVCAFVWGWVH